MARRKKNEGIFDLLLMFPWWVTLILGIGVWIYLRLQPVPGGATVLNDSILRLFLTAAQWLCLAASLVSGLLTLKRKILFASAKDIEAIRAMSWREFETLVGEAYRRQGYTVEETGGGGADGGVDLILRGKGQKILVQCKQWRSFKVGVKVVREMFGIMVAERAHRVILVTSGVYTQESYAFARGKPIDLVNGKALVQLIRDVKGESGSAQNAATARPDQTAPAKALNVQMDASDAAAPACPKCGSPMVMRTARKGANAGGQFWGCPRYPECRGIVSI